MSNTSLTPIYTSNIEISSVSEMQGLAKTFSGELNVGDLVVLDGELGAGKTFFVSALGSELGVSADITSPTFTIANNYSTVGEKALEIHHLDIYRLETVADLESRLDLDDMLDVGIVFIEWGSRILDYLVTNYKEKLIHLEILYGETDISRLVTISTYGSAMSDRTRRILGGTSG